ncbi:MAG: class I SAM-dependent methyltransferase [Candidatus Omnitrophica bacterium]|nr:class I SAM-dependent methyltransferase [Candidatus Omnitrophota bacterium]MCM8827334.1 class I SAM-dependent methyltransferase [Candidatus Omnitrophota bacterium]
MPYPENFFDGIGANLVLPYVIDFCGKKGKEAFAGVLQELFRILKPGGHLVWSTPKAGANFFGFFWLLFPACLILFLF